jgi:hypothetical protein
MVGSYNTYSPQIYLSNKALEAPSVSYKAVSISPSDSNFNTNQNFDPQTGLTNKNMEEVRTSINNIKIS